MPDPKDDTDVGAELFPDPPDDGGDASAAPAPLVLTDDQKREIVREYRESHDRKPWALGVPRTPLTWRHMVHPDDIPASRSQPQGAHVLAAVGYDNHGNIVSDRRRRDDPIPSVDSSQGFTGLEVHTGRVYQEYNEDLQSLPDRMVAFEEMRRSESAFAACEWLITVPLANVPYWFEPGDRKDPASVRFSEFLNWNLSDGLTRPFSETAREAAMGIFYGFTWAYPRYEYKLYQGEVYTGWRQFAPRARATVHEWRFEDDGGLRGLQQYGTVPTTGETKYVNYGIEEIIIWTWRGDNNDPEGLGAYRQAYKSYTYLTAMEIFAAIRVERQACGIPMATGPMGGYDTDDETKVLAIINNIRVGHDAGFVKPEGWEVEMLDMGSADIPFHGHIQRQRLNIYETVGAQFVGLSQGGSSGSNALGRDSSATFYEGLNDMADWVCQAVNTYAVPRLMERNLRELTGEQQPKLRHGKVGVRDLERYARAIELPFRERTDLPDDVVARFAEMAGLSESAVLNWMEEQKVKQAAAEAQARADGLAAGRAATPAE